MCSLSFGRSVTAFQELQEATMTYWARAAGKLRVQQVRAAAVYGFVSISRVQEERYQGSVVISLPQTSSDGREIGWAASRSMEQLHRKGE